MGEKGRENLALAHGGVAQLGEHLPCTQGVRGSNPLISTMRAILDKEQNDLSENFNGLIAQVVRARA